MALISFCVGASKTGQLLRFRAFSSSSTLCERTKFPRLVRSFGFGTTARPFRSVLRVAEQWASNLSSWQRALQRSNALTHGRLPPCCIGAVPARMANARVAFRATFPVAAGTRCGSVLTNQLKYHSAPQPRPWAGLPWLGDFDKFRNAGNILRRGCPHRCVSYLAAACPVCRNFDFHRRQ